MSRFIAMVAVSLAASASVAAAGVRVEGLRVPDGSFGSRTSVSAQVDALSELAIDGTRRVFATVSSEQAGRFDLAAESTPDGRLALVVAAVDGREQTVYLDSHRFLVSYRDGDTLHTTAWLQPKGDLLELAAAASGVSAGEAGLAFPFHAYPLHRLALASLDGVWRQSFDAIDPAALAGATAVYAAWMADGAPAGAALVPLAAVDRPRMSYGVAGDAGVEQVARRLSGSLQTVVVEATAAEVCEAEETVELASQEPYASDLDLLAKARESGEFQQAVAEECGCVVPRSATANATSASASVSGVSASLSAASVSVAALCYPDHSLGARATAGSITPSVTRGGAGCPAGSDPVGGSEVVKVTMQYKGSAKVYPNTNCCHNGPTDTASGPTASISFGGQSFTLSGPTASGDWIRGDAAITATGKVCYEEDLIFNDLLSITITGSSTASGS